MSCNFIASAFHSHFAQVYKNKAKFRKINKQSACHHLVDAMISKYKWRRGHIGALYTWNENISFQSSHTRGLNRKTMKIFTLVIVFLLAIMLAPIEAGKPRK